MESDIKGKGTKLLHLPFLEEDGDPYSLFDIYVTYYLFTVAEVKLRY